MLYQVLQSLEEGRKGHPPIFLGAAAIASLPIPSTPSSSKLQLWMHASLNEQLLGSRLAALISEQEALGLWYEPGAILLQPQLLRPVVKAVKGCDVLRFDLAVGGQQQQVVPGDGGSSSSSNFQNPGGAVGAAAAAAAASLGFKGLAQRLGGSAGDEGQQHQQQQGAGVAAGEGKSRSKGRQQKPSAAAAAAAGDGGGGSGVQEDVTVMPSSVATFQWPGAAAAAGGGGVCGANGSEGSLKGPISSGRRRRVVPIKEVDGNTASGDTESMASATSGFMSPSSSGMLSPLATSEDAAADWWTPMMEAYGNAASSNAPEGVGGGISGCTGAGGEQGGVVGYGGEGTGHGGNLGGGGGDGGGERGLVEGSGRSASRQLEQQLSATLAAPLPELLTNRRGSIGKLGCARAEGSWEQENRARVGSNGEVWASVKVKMCDIGFDGNLPIAMPPSKRSRKTVCQLGVLLFDRSAVMFNPEECSRLQELSLFDGM